MRNEGLPVTRVAALYDIHGNLTALAAVLDEVRQAGVDLVVVGGDVVPGPLPRETLARLLDLDLPVAFIHGYGERAVLAEMAGADSGLVPDERRRLAQWAAAQLPPEYAPVLAAWPLTRTVAVAGLGEVLFCHATPQNDMDIFTRLTPEERLLPVFAGLSAAVVVCGHTHMQFDRMIGGVRVVNAGSVGMPFGAPGAYWLLLGPDVQFRHTPYDLDQAAARIRASAYPDAEDFAAFNVLQPPTEEDVLAHFAAVGL
jgi:predicted phosphodiesterase